MSRIPFGKHRGTSITELATQEPGYVNWLLASSEHGWVDEHRAELRQALQDVARAKADACTITLTEHQAEIAAQTLAQLDTDSVAQLFGGAGYGKSFTTAQVGAALIRQGYKVRATAVSYVATQVLAQVLEPVGIDCATVARMLKFQKTWEGDKEVYGYSEDTPDVLRNILSEGNALVVDECSMIADDLAIDLIAAAEIHGGKLIFVGDSHQLPPVGQETISAACAFPEAPTLTVPMRYSTDSRLYQVEQAMRRDPTVLWRYSNMTSSKAVAVFTSTGALIEHYVAQYRAHRGLHKLYLFTRKGVMDANQRIREALHGSTDLPVVVEDEALMILATTDYPAGVGREMGGTRYYSGQHFRVLSYKEAVYTFRADNETIEIPHIIAQLDNQQMPVRLIFGQTEASLDPTKLGSAQMQQALAAARKLGKEDDDWQPYRRLMSDFVRVQYTYATTVHRAQGQTVDYAYTAPKQLLSVGGIMGNALTYVAMTRAKKHLAIAL